MSQAVLLPCSPRVVAVTPAGRRRYLEVLKTYVLADEGIAEWQLWDNCRDPADRAYILALAERHAKIRIMRLPGSDGGNRAINRFYRFCTDPGVFYIKMDDDLMWLPPGFAADFLARALAGQGRYLWWSPLVVNNAVCAWLLQQHGALRIAAPLSAQANDPHGWRNPRFAEALHRAFLAQLRGEGAGLFRVADASVSVSRFSINCLGLFGADVAALGAEFCPAEADDEEWISAVLTYRTGRPGRVLGDLAVAHFGFFTQERHLLGTDVLDQYYDLAGLPRVAHAPGAQGLRARWRDRLQARLLRLPESYEIGPAPVAAGEAPGLAGSTPPAPS